MRVGRGAPRRAGDCIPRTLTPPICCARGNSVWQAAVAQRERNFQSAVVRLQHVVDALGPSAEVAKGSPGTNSESSPDHPKAATAVVADVAAPAATATGELAFALVRIAELQAQCDRGVALIERLKARLARQEKDREVRCPVVVALCARAVFPRQTQQGEPPMRAWRFTKSILPCAHYRGSCTVKGNSMPSFAQRKNMLRKSTRWSIGSHLLQALRPVLAMRQRGHWNATCTCYADNTKPRFAYSRWRWTPFRHERLGWFEMHHHAHLCLSACRFARKTSRRCTPRASARSNQSARATRRKCARRTRQQQRRELATGRSPS